MKMLAAQAPGLAATSSQTAYVAYPLVLTTSGQLWPEMLLCI